jgi:alpha-D-ribose 1-methylphosphonate 5-triphosphate synthase subunit PhnG
MQREELNFILQHVKLETLKKVYKKIDKKFGVMVVSKPSSQTLLVPIKDPISQGEFYSGEVLVTSTILEVNKHKGWSMVQDDNEKLSLYIACCDAAFEFAEFKQEIIDLCEETKSMLDYQQLILNKKVNSTKVNFDLMEG